MMNIQPQKDANHVCASLVPIFSQLEPKQLCQVSKLVQRRSYSQGEIIALSKDKADHIYIIHKGQLRFFHESPDGKGQTLYYLRQGDFFTEPGGNHFRKFSPVKAVALEDTQLCLLHKSDLKRILQEQPDVGINILEAILLQLRQIETLVASLSLRNAEQRLAAWLYQRMTHSGTPVPQGIKITVPFSRAEIAELLGTTQETVSRRLSKLQTDGILKLDGQRNVIILQPDTLESLIC